jgi:hypothetical protein
MRIKKVTLVAIVVVVLALAAGCVWLYLGIITPCCAPPPIMPR